jgi:RNA-directed DNA polymerase
MTTAPTRVPRATETNQAGSIRSRWSWVEPSIWTDRMLAALETGVKGGKWFSLIDKVHSVSALRASFQNVKANRGAAGVDHETIARFEARLEENLAWLSARLRAGTYRPQAVRRVWIDKPGGRDRRPLGIPTVRDRVVQGALRAALEPIFERTFAPHSYGFRPQRGAKDALRRVNALLGAGYTWVVDADLRSYFDTIPHEPLMDRLRTRVADGCVLKLVEAYLKQDVLETAQRWTPTQGSPQGAVLSPLLSNLYLDPLDHHMAARGYQMVRYADDFVILCRCRADAQQALQEVQQWTAEAGLCLHPDKTCLVDASQRGGFDFLGYHFERGYRWPRRKAVQKLKTALRPKTRRTNGQSLEEIIGTVNRTLRGWFEYFKHSHWTTFAPIDQWVRMRLRSIKRRRGRRRGRGRGADHQRWPNAYFAACGLFSLTAAHALARQSPTGGNR